MKKQAFTAALLSALLITAMAVAFLIGSATAASEYAPEIFVSSPTEGKTYTVNSVKLQFSVYMNQTAGLTVLDYWRISYSLDGKALGASLEPNVVSGYITMKVPNGEHTVEILARAAYVPAPNVIAPSPGPWWYFSQVVVRFAVDTGVGPSVSVLGLGKYKTNEVSLNITIDVPDAKVTYSLDGQRNVSVPSSELVKYDKGYQYSVALANMTDGVHTLTAYATDALGYTGMAEKTFTVNATSVPQPEPNGVFPTTATIAAVASVVAAIVGIGLLVYFSKKRRAR